jgi:ADP-ribose pyrophosphatase YjhB (NUDIX family)
MIGCKFENGVEANLRHVTVDTLVVKENQILLIKRGSTAPKCPNMYALPGGYLDRDENTTTGALRELLEETGYKGKIISLFRVVDKPDRKGEDRQNVTFVYLVEVNEKALEHDDEVSEVKWFEVEKLPDDKEIAFDHAETIRMYREYTRKKFTLPVIG